MSNNLFFYQGEGNDFIINYADFSTLTLSEIVFCNRKTSEIRLIHKIYTKSLFLQIYFIPLVAIISPVTAVTAADAKRTLSNHLVLIMKSKQFNVCVAEFPFVQI